MPKYVLHYFNARGRAEVPRMLLLAGGIEYTDRRFEFQDWPAIKPTTPLGQVPYLEIDGVILPQSNSIGRYLANETKLAGKNLLEQAQADAIVDTCADTLNSYIQKVFDVPDQEKENAAKKFLIEEIPKHLGNIEKLIGLYGKNGYAVGESLTWADLYIYELISSIEARYKTSLTEQYQHLAGNKKLVEAHPKIGPYVKNRPESAF